MRPPFFRASLLFAAALVLVGCGREAATRASGPPPPVPVQVAVAEQRDVPRVIVSVGTVQALRTVAVKSQVDGVLAQIHFKEGDDVRAGDPLVTLDRRPFANSLNIARADLANAEATAAQARADLARYQTLAGSGVVSPEELLQYTTKNNTAAAAAQAKAAAVANAELLLGYTEIRAPIAGRTGELMLHEGALVRANDSGAPIVTVNQLAPVAVAYAVPESALGAIRAALAEKSVVVTVADRATGLAREGGTLEFVDNAVDPATGMIGLKAAFANEDRALWPGRFVSVTTQVGLDRAAVVVPSPAVQTSQSGSTLYVLKADGTVELRAVQVARVAGDLTLLAGGLAAGETVVTDGQLRLMPGARAVVKPLAAPPRREPGAAPARGGLAK
jgi:multidrug efflux system membrane fusion protein